MWVKKQRIDENATNTNSVLKRITQKIYSERKPLPREQKTNYRIERVNNSNFCELWFVTEGCRHDMSGGCTMCNYGKGSFFPEDEILRELKDTVAALPKEYEEFIITPIGSMLDEREVSGTFRLGLKEILKGIHSKCLITETRADTVTEEGLEYLKDMFLADEQCVELGLESSDDWILRNCVNKGCFAQDCRKAVRLIQNAGMYSIINVGIGIPFISEHASVIYALETIKQVFEWGADSVVLFPYHVKPGTLAAHLYKMGEYYPASLWSLAKVLQRLPRGMEKKVRISWYKNYYTDPTKIIASPSTCEKCGYKVMELLDEYKNLQKAETIQKIANIECECRALWKRKIEGEATFPKWEYIERLYRKLAAEYEIPEALLTQELEVMEHSLWEKLRGK